MSRTRKFEPDALSRLAADLRVRIGDSQKEFSKRVPRSRFAVIDYERGSYRTPIGYVAFVAHILAKQEATNGHIAPSEKAALLTEVNIAITTCHGGRRAFDTWDQLVAEGKRWSETDRSRTGSMSRPIPSTLTPRPIVFQHLRWPHPHCSHPAISCVRPRPTL